MAIVNDFSKFGTSFSSAYHRITRLSYEVNEMYENVLIAEATTDEEGNTTAPEYEMQWVKRAHASGEVTTYSSQAARENHNEALAKTYFSFAVDMESADNWMEQAYAHIKTLEQFTGATDVI